MRVYAAPLIGTEEHASPTSPPQHHHSTPLGEAHPPSMTLGERDLVFPREPNDLLGGPSRPGNEASDVGVGDADVRPLTAVTASGAAEGEKTFPAWPWHSGPLLDGSAERNAASGRL
jgi:hypothetical protein